MFKRRHMILPEVESAVELFGLASKEAVTGEVARKPRSNHNICLRDEKSSVVVL